MSIKLTPIEYHLAISTVCCDVVDLWSKTPPDITTPPAGTQMTPEYRRQLDEFGDKVNKRMRLFWDEIGLKSGEEATQKQKKIDSPFPAGITARWFRELGALGIGLDYMDSQTKCTIIELSQSVGDLDAIRGLASVIRSASTLAGTMENKIKSLERIAERHLVLCYEAEGKQEEAQRPDNQFRAVLPREQTAPAGASGQLEKVASLQQGKRS